MEPFGSDFAIRFALATTVRDGYFEIDKATSERFPGPMACGGNKLFFQALSTAIEDRKSLFFQMKTASAGRPIDLNLI